LHYLYSFITIFLLHDIAFS